MTKQKVIMMGVFAIALFYIYGRPFFDGSVSSAWQEKINWTDAGTSKEEIAAMGKPVYLFVTTDWCTYCKKMKQQVFTNPAVQEQLNTNFTNIVINPETEGTARFMGEALSYKDLAQKLNVTGYPTSFFFDKDGGFLGAQPGYIDAKSFSDIAAYIGEGHYTSLNFDEFKNLPDRN